MRKLTVKSISDGSIRLLYPPLIYLSASDTLKPGKSNNIISPCVGYYSNLFFQIMMFIAEMGKDRDL